MKKCLWIAIMITFSIRPIIGQTVAKNADKEFNNQQYETAIKLYKESFLKYKDIENRKIITFQIAECYRLLRDFKNAELWYFKCSQWKLEKANLELYLAQAYRENGKIEEAIIQYELFYEKLGQNIPDSIKTYIELNSKIIGKQVTEIKNTPSNDNTKLFIQSKQEIATLESNNQQLADVDFDIPEGIEKKLYRFALIIGNEDYSSYQRDLNSEINVDFAERDAKYFKLYCEKVLGVSTENIIYLINAKSIEMDRAIKQINLLSKSTNGKAELIFYYAGHGIPDEKSKEPYLIPVDVSASDLKYAFKLKDIYKSLTEFPNERVTVFLDACFSGGARNQGLLAARGVKIKPKDDLLLGNIVVFSASSGDQSALQYKAKRHGLFTYYLLMKIKETKGDLTYKDLSEFLKEQISIKSVLVNKREQNPQINISPTISEKWLNWKIK